MKKNQSNKDSRARKILSKMVWVLSVALYFIGEVFLKLKKLVQQSNGGKTAKKPEKQARVAAAAVVEKPAPAAAEKKTEKPVQPAAAAAKAAKTHVEPAAEKENSRGKVLRMVVICLLSALLCVLLAIGAVRLVSSIRANRIYKDLSSTVQQIKNPEANGTPVTTMPPENKEPVGDLSDEPTELADAVPTEPVAETVPQETEPQMLAHYAQLYEKNSDLFGWVKIDDTKIDYPVMYAPDNLEKYLHKDFEGNSFYGGTPYMDVRCTADSENYLIYGHNMKNGTMFKHLQKYQDESFWEKHQTVYFDTLYKEGEYEVVAAFYDRVYNSYEDVFKFYNVIELEDEASYNDAVAKLKEKSIYETGVTPQYGAQLVTLITCAYHTDNGKFVVVLAEKAAG